jgi:hypothetical protein
MAHYRVQYTISEVYETIIEADSQEQARYLFDNDDYNEGQRIDAWTEYDIFED